MAYIVNNTTGSLSIPVADGQKDTSSLAITLIGKNSPNYGEALNENLVKMLENFASTTEPSGSKLTGQLWYNTTDNTLRVYNGTSFVKSGSTIFHETLPNAVSYLTHVSSVSGTPDLKTVGVKGLTVTPYTGNVGIGISTISQHKLTINGQYLDPTRSFPQFVEGGGASNIPLAIHGQDGHYALVAIGSYSNTPAHLAAFGGRRARGTAAAPAAVQANDYLSGLFAFGYDGASFSSSNQGALAWYASENWSAGNHGTELVINVTKNGEAVGSNAVVIRNNLDFEVTGDVVAFRLSDQRLKKDIAKIPNALSKVLQLDGVYFKWNDQSDKADKTKTQVGIIAQQVQSVLPEATQEKANGYLGVDYEKLIPLLIESIKELKAEIEELKSK